MIHVADNTFLLHGKHTTYAIGRDDEGRLYHLHYGKRLNNHDHAMHRYAYRGQSAMDINRKDRSAEVLNDVGWAPKDSRGISLDESPQEYPAFGKFDLRSPAYQLELAEGNRITDARLVSYRIESGKPVLPGMPSASGSAEEAQTLILTLHDEVEDILYRFLCGIPVQAIQKQTGVIGSGTPDQLQCSSDIPYEWMSKTAAHMMRPYIFQCQAHAVLSCQRCGAVYTLRHHIHPFIRGHIAI